MCPLKVILRDIFVDEKISGDQEQFLYCLYMKTGLRLAHFGDSLITGSHLPLISPHYYMHSAISWNFLEFSNIPTSFSLNKQELFYNPASYS